VPSEAYFETAARAVRPRRNIATALGPPSTASWPAALVGVIRHGAPPICSTRSPRRPGARRRWAISCTGSGSLGARRRLSRAGSRLELYGDPPVPDAPELRQIYRSRRSSARSTVSTPLLRPRLRACHLPCRARPRGWANCATRGAARSACQGLLRAVPRWGLRTTPASKPRASPDVSWGCPVCPHPAAAEIATGPRARLVRWAPVPRLLRPAATHRGRAQRVTTASTSATRRGPHGGPPLASSGDFFERVRPAAGAGCSTSAAAPVTSWRSRAVRGWQPTGIDLSATRGGALARGAASTHAPTGRDCRPELRRGHALGTSSSFSSAPSDAALTCIACWRRWPTSSSAPERTLPAAAYRLAPAARLVRSLARLLGNAYTSTRCCGARPPWPRPSRAPDSSRSGSGQAGLGRRPVPGPLAPGPKAAVDAAKRLVLRCARGTGAATHGRVLVGSSALGSAQQGAVEADPLVRSLPEYRGVPRLVWGARELCGLESDPAVPGALRSWGFGGHFGAPFLWRDAGQARELGEERTTTSAASGGAASGGAPSGA